MNTSYYLIFIPLVLRNVKMPDRLISISSNMSCDPSPVDFFPFLKFAIAARADETLLIQNLDVRDVPDMCSDLDLVLNCV